MGKMGPFNDHRTKIHADFWDRFVLLAKVCYYINEEADLFDAFDKMRVKWLGGRNYSGTELDRLDAEIRLEESILVGV